ncbi:MAG: BON domain-containing protein [Armatimonadetes bacterium]|nr:BON domain-containing protein [Armatimonadota bacterium]
MKYTILLTVAMGLGLGALGCGNSNEASQKAAEATQDAMKGAEHAGKDMGAATMLTPAIKLAITADARLNDPRNLINVDSTDEKVKLTGHVTSNDLKSLAEELTRKVLDDKKAKQAIDNELSIKP